MLSRIMGALARRRSALRTSEPEGGFTLVELLVVVIIIGILAAIAIPVYLGVQSTAKDNAVKADLTDIKTALVAYEVQNPGTTVTDLGTLPGIKVDSSNYTSGETPAFVGTPTDTSFCIAATGSNGNPFHISNSGSAQSGATCS